KKGKSVGLGGVRRFFSAVFVLLIFFSIFFFVFAPVLARRVEFLDENGAVVLSFPLYLGESFSTEYIHSVQLCPVVDEYYAIGDFLWLWEERTQSTNAGLPTEAPRLGRFVHDPPWYRYIGGRRSFKSLRSRVGDARMGRNTLTLPTGKKIDLFQRFPGALLTMRLR
ncbi:MAG: DUF1850 domain-containing protein, partial [Synergistaceae bacterium]|nr:DUF1850 domain-containing protein [Synergistaceae bacterium]